MTNDEVRTMTDRMFAAVKALARDVKGEHHYVVLFMHKDDAGIAVQSSIGCPDCLKTVLEETAAAIGNGAELEVRRAH